MCNRVSAIVRPDQPKVQERKMAELIAFETRKKQKVEEEAAENPPVPEFLTKSLDNDAVKAAKCALLLLEDEDGNITMLATNTTDADWIWFAKHIEYEVMSGLYGDD